MRPRPPTHVLALVLAGCAASLPPGAQASIDGMALVPPRLWPEALRREFEPGVVAIDAGRSQGSGVVVRSRAGELFVLTNEHVAEDVALAGGGWAHVPRLEKDGDDAWDVYAV